MKRLLFLVLSLSLMLTSVPLVVFTTAVGDEDVSALLGEETVNPAFTMDVSAPAEYYAGREVKVTVTVNNINTENGLQHVRGHLYFDTDILGFNFALREDKEIKNAFRGYKEWTSMTKLAVDEQGRWYIAVDAVTVGEEDEETGDFAVSDVTENGVLVFDITFVAKADAKGDTALYIPHSTVIGDYCALGTSDKIKYYGNGSGVAVLEGDVANAPTEDQPSEDPSSGEESSEPEASSEPEEPSNSEEPSEPEESAPPMEDKDLLGEENEDPNFTLDITAPQKYIAGKKVNVTVTVNNVNAGVGLQHVRGRLYFNPEILGFTFDLKVNKELKKTFNGYNEWEGFSKLGVDEDGKWFIVVDAATTGVEDEETGEYIYSNVTEDGVLSFTFAFIAKEDAVGDAVIFIPHSTVVGDFYHPVTSAHTSFIGNGSGAKIIQDLEPHYCKAEGDWQYNKKNHWKLCQCLDELEKAAHEMEWVVTTAPDFNTEGEQKHICKTCGYVDDTETIPAKGLKGDINENGYIDTMDYIFLKRAYFGTYVLKKPAVGDINNNGGIDSMDYVFLKRAYFGTYIIK